MVGISHFQLFLYVFTFVAAVGLGLLFVKQKGPGVADSDTLPRTVAEFDRILRESTKVADFEQILANQNYVDQKCKEAAAVAVEASTQPISTRGTLLVYGASKRPGH